ncbi:MAG: hypothetical protein LBO20_06915 [Bifidobacteriaceae bacterium]|jgi:hypothetical protein|nr:hypothetical protein [Bifidobacteriaceae bacterium]
MSDTQFTPPNPEEPRQKTLSPDPLFPRDAPWQDAIRAAAEGRRLGAALRGDMEIPPGFHPILGRR